MLFINNISWYNKWTKKSNIIIDEKKDISSTDSLSLQKDSDSIKSNISSENNPSSDAKNNQTSNYIEYNNPFEEDSYEKKDLSDYYDNFYN